MRDLLRTGVLSALLLGGFLATAAPAAAHTEQVAAAPRAPMATGAATAAGVATLYATAAVSADDVWAVGNAGAVPAALAEHWNGQAWVRVPVPDPHGATSSTLYGVAAVSADDVWAVGYSSSGSGKNSRESALTEHWNGHHWALVPSADPGAPKCRSVILFAATAVSADDVWASGYACAGTTQAVGALVEHWDGRRWAQVKTPATAASMLLSIAVVSARDVWAAGNALLSSGVQVPLVEHWNGRAWTRVASPRPAGATTSVLNGLTAVSAGDVWAVGTAQTEKVGRTLIEHWNGHAWRRVLSPNPGGAPTATFAYLQGVTAASGHDVWAVGYRSSAKAINTLIEHWDGRAWIRVASPNGGWGGALTGAVVVGADDVWTVGQSLAQTLRSTALTERWDGHAWRRVIAAPAH